MEFWGIEIKPGKPFMVEPEDGYVIHVSQVSLDETKKLKEDENVAVYVKVADDETKYTIGTLSQRFPQVSLDLFFAQEFEFSHNSKTSVYLLGYKTPDVSDEQDEEIESDSEMDEFMVQQCGLMPPEEKVGTGMPYSDGSDSDEMGSDDEEEEEEDDDEEVEDEAPLKVEPLSKKRPNGEEMKNTVASKKTKVAGGKKKCSFPCGPCKN